MPDNVSPSAPIEEEEYGNDIVTVTGEDGKTYEFERLDAIETDDGRFLALLPLFEDPQATVEDAGELIIVQVKEDEDGVLLAPIEDDDLLDEIAEIFEERLSEYYDVTSDEEE